MALILTFLAFQIVEFGAPGDLIGKEGGIFRNMCIASGSFGELEAIAKKAQ